MKKTSISYMIVLGLIVLTVAVLSVHAQDSQQATKDKETTPPAPYKDFNPPTCTGIFDDVDPGIYCNYIEQIYNDGIVSGCASNPLRYCPDLEVDRAQMAVFVGRAMHGDPAGKWAGGFAVDDTSPGGFDGKNETSGTEDGAVFAYTNVTNGESGIYLDDKSILLWAAGGTGTGDVLRVYDFDDSADSEVEVFRVGPGTIYLYPDTPNETTASRAIFFYEDSSATGESIFWNDTNDRFQFTDEVYVDDDATINGDLAVEGDEIVIGTTSYDKRLRFFETGSTSVDASLLWDYDKDFIYINEDLRLFGTLSVGNANSEATRTYNFLGPGTSIAGNTVSSASDLFISQDLEVGSNLYLAGQMHVYGRYSSGYDTDQYIYFYNNGARNTNYIMWDEGYTGADCGGSIDEAFVWSLYAEENSGWIFQNTYGGTDREVIIRENGSMYLDGSLTQSAGCDLAESFLGPELEYGMVVAIDPNEREAVRAADEPYQATVIGVVSAHPGLLLNGPTAGALPLIEEYDALLRISNRDAKLSARMVELEQIIDGWQRGNIPVALSGRVPVKVDGTFGAIRAGDHLTASSNPGHAMVMDQAGTTIGVALEDFTGKQGKIMVMLQRGWFSPSTDVTQVNIRQEVARQLEELQAIGALTVTGTDPAKTALSVGGTATGSEAMRVNPEGNLHASYVPVKELVEVGDVLVADTATPGLMRRGSSQADRAVVGIVTREPGILLGGELAAMPQVAPELAEQLRQARQLGDSETEAEVWSTIEQRFRSVHAAIALAGIVEARADAGYGEIQVGDLLTTSPTAGHAMRADAPEPGTVLGKALEPLPHGTGTIKVLVMLR